MGEIGQKIDGDLLCVLEITRIFTLGYHQRRQGVVIMILEVIGTFMLARSASTSVLFL